MTKPVLPYRQVSINEGSALDLELTHLDKNKVLQIPTELRYRIDDLSNNLEVLDWTIVPAPGSTNTITLTDTQNALFSRSLRRQKMQVSVKTTSNTGAVLQEDFIYEIIRIFTREEQLDT